MPAEYVRARRITVFVTDDEHAELKRRAALAQMKPPEFLRAAALNTWPPIPPAVPELNQQAWFDLARAAANLNQLARAFNKDERLVDIDMLRRELADFRAALVGATDDEGDE